MRRGAGGRLEKLLTGINITAIAALRTDDRGLFRVAGLPPGEYIVSVSEQAQHGVKSGEGPGSRDPTMSVLEGLAGQQFLTTFYPSATTVKEAAVVKADAGLERNDIDITIPDRPLHTVGGTVHAKTDKRPVKNAKIIIVRRDEDAGGAGEPNADEYSPGGVALSNTTTTDNEGRWQFTDIPEGPYALVVKPAEEYESVASEEPEVSSTLSSGNTNASGGVGVGMAYTRTRRKNGFAPARRDLQVISSDLTDVNVELNEGARVAGVVTFESGAKRESYGTVILVRVPDGSEASASDESRSTYASGGRFEVGGLPAGKYYLQFNAYGEEGKLYVKSVTWNGRDFTREPLELGDGMTAENVRIVVSNNGAASGAGVYLVTADAPERQLLMCTTDAEGNCEIYAPPGDYRVVVLPPGVANFEAELKRRTATAPRLTLAAGESKDFEVAVPEK